MKIDRLIGILSILLQQEKVTAPFLAEKFEVSRRTINRDIEDLCMAGIPLVTTQGKNGGISIMDGYAIDRTLLTSSDMQSILAGLSSLDSISGTNRYQQLMAKLSMGNSSILTSNNHIIIDLTSWYKTELTPKIELIQAAIHSHQTISFFYYSPKTLTKRTIEPYSLVFQWSSWYLYGYCLDRSDYRMFKLNRMQDLTTNNQQIFNPREAPPFKRDDRGPFQGKYKITALFDPSVEWRLVDEFGLNYFVKQDDGRLLFQYDEFTGKDSVFSWLLTFGDKAELLEPQELKIEFVEMINELCKIYN